MMHKGKKEQYVSAGVQGTPGMRLNVRSSVRLPDSEAGAAWYDESQKPYYAETLPQQKREPLTVPLNAALIFLCVLFVVFGGMILGRMVRRAAIAKDISAMEAAILETRKSNAELQVKVAEARDLARIGYDASHRLNMIAASKAETVAVQAPDTRPFENESAVAQASPHPADAGKITGSR